MNLLGILILVIAIVGIGFRILTVLNDSEKKKGDPLLTGIIIIIVLVMVFVLRRVLG